MKYPRHFRIVPSSGVFSPRGADSWSVSALMMAAPVAIRMSGGALFLGLWMLGLFDLRGAADLYLRDTPQDLGVEPNVVSGTLWASDDLWVRQEADPSYQPYPTRETAPAWIPLPHQNPVYREPGRFLPNYIYVRVRNRGNTASTGSERLRIYWSVEGAHPKWPDDFVDRLTASCDGNRLVARGMEVTQLRKNAARATAEERETLVKTILEWGQSTDPRLPEGTTWWSHVARMYSQAPSWAHDTPGFLVWNRAFLQQIELWLQEKNPRFRLMYWDWTTDPEKSENNFNFFTPDFMGHAGRGAPEIAVGAPFEPIFSSKVFRALREGVADVRPDSLILNASDFSEVRRLIELESWNKANAYVSAEGNLGSRKTAAEDPFFLLICANADRLWAEWQRNPNFPARLDALTTYGLESSSSALQELSLSPWNGDLNLFPWEQDGGQVAVKTAKDASLVMPSGYDLAPLVVPVLQPGEAVILQIPWYPPDSAKLRFECGTAEGPTVGITLLARIETIADSPFGMAEPESTDVAANVRANNNIAMRRVRVLDDFPGATKVAEVIVRNDEVGPVMRSFRLSEAGSAGEPSFLSAGQVVVDLGGKLFNRWEAAGSHGTGLEVLGEYRIRLLNNLATIQDIPLDAGEIFPITVHFEISSNAPPQFGQVSRMDWIHLGDVGAPDAVVGGERFVIDYNRLVLVKTGSRWSFWDRGDSVPGPDWVNLSFDDSSWQKGLAPLGYGEPEVRTRLREILTGDASVTAFFRQSFFVDDPSFFHALQLRVRHDDGIIVYLNGQELYRNKLSIGTIEPSTFAQDPLVGVNEQLYRIAHVDAAVSLLKKGENQLAVEIHQAAILNPDSAPIPDDDLFMDLELSANPPGVNQQPFIRVFSPERFSVHQFGSPIAIEAESMDVDGSIRNGIFQGDNLILATFAKIDPVKLFHEKFSWLNARVGRRVVTVASFDELGSLSFVQQPILVVNNRPPRVRVTAPQDGSMLTADVPWSLELETSDTSGGVVSRVDLFVRRGERMDEPWQLLGTLFEPPYIWEAEPLAPGDYRIQAIATDDAGLVTVSVPVRLFVPAPENILLQYRVEADALILEWTPVGAVLEEADTTDGPWTTVQQASSPWRVELETGGKSKGRFYRLRSGK